MRIQEICQKTGIKKRNVHFYIKEKLLFPELHSTKGYYVFSEEDLERLVLIQMFRTIGLPIPVIRSLLNTPPTAGLYLNYFVKQLKLEQKRIKQIINSMDSFIEHLPIKPDVHSLYLLSKDVDISDSISEQFKTYFDANDNTQVNRFLWSMFLPQTPFTEYQEFLWEKLNRLTRDTDNVNIRKISRFLATLSLEEMDLLFYKKDQHIEYRANLDEEGCVRYIEELKDRIPLFLESEENIEVWKRYYDSFFYPQVEIYDSEISRIMYEMSPLFSEYCNNIHTCCTRLYQWMQETEEGAGLHGRLLSALEGYVNLTHSRCGELEVLANFSQLVLGNNW